MVHMEVPMLGLQEVIIRDRLVDCPQAVALALTDTCLGAKCIVREIPTFWVIPRGEVLCFEPGMSPMGSWFELFVSSLWRCFGRLWKV